MHVSAETHKGVYLTQVLANDPVCREHWKFVLEVHDFPPAEPGQFIQILCREPDDAMSGDGAFIRRPFSIAGLRRRGRTTQIDIIHRLVGRGTHWLSRLHPGDSVSVLGPLGHPFTLAEDRSGAYLVGGGCGLPPLIWLAQTLRAAGKTVVAFCGARTADMLPLTRRPKIQILPDQPTLAIVEFAACDVPALISTDDGSLGFTGSSSQIFAHYLSAHREEDSSAVVYTCGPEAMMHAVAELAQQRNIPCQVCLERMMACGMGTCQSCVVRIHDKAAPEGWIYRLCCTDGPVFDSRMVIWES